MNVNTIIRQLCGPRSARIHRARAKAVEAVAETIARTGTLLPSRLGRSVSPNALPKHGIKRVDRLLSNAKLHAERILCYRAIAQRVVGTAPSPVVIIDWSGTVKGLYTLSAAVPVADVP